MPLRNAELADILLKKGMTVSFAESCTGGLLSSIITSLPGSSAYFKGSAVTYSNESKIRLLNVRESTLIAYGAVSPQTAIEMAEGARSLFSTDISGSITGIAGPDGGTDEKPVGTVFMSITDGTRHVEFGFRFDGDRNTVQRKTAETMIEKMIEFLS